MRERSNYKLKKQTAKPINNAVYKCLTWPKCLTVIPRDCNEAKKKKKSSSLSGMGMILE